MGEALPAQVQPCCTISPLPVCVRKVGGNRAGAAGIQVGVLCHLCSASMLSTLMSGQRVKHLGPASLRLTLDKPEPSVGLQLVSSFPWHYVSH